MTQLTYTPAAQWLGGRLDISFNLTQEQEAQVEARVGRAVELLEDSSYAPKLIQFEPFGIVAFKGGAVRAELHPDRVGCTCRDMAVRKLPCKHTIAAASLLGDPILDATEVQTELPGFAAITSPPKKRQKGKKEPRAQDIRVGEYYLLSDFLFNNLAIIHGVPNMPESFDGDEVAGIKGLCEAILDPVAKQFGKPSITHAFQSLELWEAKYGEKGSPNDLHSYRLNRGGVGGAADILCHGHEPDTIARWIRDRCEFDRLIVYPDRPILCVAWTSVKPRSHCKTWLRGKYVNLD
jgi:hypothetical protein